MAILKPSPSVSMETFHIAGIITEVYGLDALSKSCETVSCLWLLHPRGQTKECMSGIAASCIDDWNRRPEASNVGLLAIGFDQRNHGSREVNASSNGAWIEGNESHAQDMFSVIHGTVIDTSLLMDHIGSYILAGPNDPTINQHLVLGVSLGGHAAWQCLFGEPRVTAAVVIIGSPDYMLVMNDRARLSKLPTHGSDFLGSKDFPRALISALEKQDPKALLFSTSDITTSPSEAEQRRLRLVLDQKIKGKQVLVCSGADDKLVPYRCSKPFLDFFKEATSGWYMDGNVYVEDIVYPGTGHKYSDPMKVDSVRFISDVLAGSSSKIASKI